MPNEPLIASALAAAPAAGAAFQICIKKQKEMSQSDYLGWWQRECRSGGELAEYIRIEKARTTERYRKVACRQAGFKQNNRSDVRRIADIPLRDYYRWLEDDPDFWRDDKNLRSLRRDNPDAQIYL